MRISKIWLIASLLAVFMLDAEVVILLIVEEAQHYLHQTPSPDREVD